MYSVDDWEWFVHIVLPAFRSSGLLFTRQVPGGGFEVWWNEGGRLTNLTSDPARFAALVVSSSAYRTSAGRQQVSRQSVQLLHSLCRDVLLSTPALCSVQDPVTFILERPGLVYQDGRFVLPPRGFSPGIFSLCEPPEVSGRAPDRLRWFFRQIGLDPAEQARVLAFYATVLLRDCFMAAPALLVRSPWKGTGKTSIARLGAYLSAGRPSECALRWARDDSEFAKLLPALGTNAPFVWVDNIVAVDRPLSSEIINQGTQNGTYNCRILGRSEVATALRPTFALTMQGGLIEEDLLDRLLIVNILHRPPLKVSGADNIQGFVTREWEIVRDELFSLILSTEPLPASFEWPVGTPASAYRFPEWYRFVAPSVAAAGLDPASLLVDNLWHESRAELQDLARFLAKETDRAGPEAYFSVDELLLRLPKHGFAALGSVCSEALDIPTRRAALRALLRGLPEIITGQHAQYRLKSKVTSAGPLYRIDVHTQE